MGETKPDPMDVERVLEALNRALALQQRSVLQLTMGAGSMFGLEFQAVGSELWLFARAELDDTKLLVDEAGEAHAGDERAARGRITALGGEPTVDVAPLSWHEDPRAAVDALIEAEEETVAALHAVIPHSGQEPRSEALEHLMEHLIMRKQNQVDWLRRARRSPT
jgi:bacterioferritin (cytochrome b1)